MKHPRDKHARTQFYRDVPSSLWRAAGYPRRKGRYLKGYFEWEDIHKTTRRAANRRERHQTKEALR